MNAYEVTFRVWANSESEARQMIDAAVASEVVNVQLSDDQDPPGAWLEGKVQT